MIELLLHEWFQLIHKINRGYYMPIRVISTWYLTSELCSLVRYQVEHKKIKFISISEYVIFCLLYKHQWNTKSACFQRRVSLCNHNDGDLFTCEDNRLSSHVKIWIFLGKLTWYFTGFYVIIHVNTLWFIESFWRVQISEKKIWFTFK